MWWRGGGREGRRGRGTALSMRNKMGKALPSYLQLDCPFGNVLNNWTIKYRFIPSDVFS